MHNAANRFAFRDFKILWIKKGLLIRRGSLGVVYSKKNLRKAQKTRNKRSYIKQVKTIAKRSIDTA